MGYALDRLMPLAIPARHVDRGEYREEMLIQFRRRSSGEPARAHLGSPFQVDPAVRPYGAIRLENGLEVVVYLLVGQPLEAA